MIDHHNRSIIIVDWSSSSIDHHWSIIIDRSSSSIDHHQWFIIIIDRSSSCINHHHVSIIIIDRSSSLINHHHRLIIIIDRSSSLIIHHHRSINIIIHQSIDHLHQLIFLMMMMTIYSELYEDRLHLDPSKYSLRWFGKNQENTVQQVIKIYMNWENPMLCIVV